MKIGFIDTQEKIQADKSYDVNKNKKLSLRAFINHKISFLTLINHTKSINDVRIFVKQSAGEKQFNLDNIKIFWLDYLTTSKSSSPFFNVGKYFDPLVESYIKEKNGVNNILKDVNQLFLFQVEVDDLTSFGVYSFEINFVGETINEKLVLKLLVEDIALNKQIECKNLFGVMTEDISPDLDFRQELNKINSVLNKYCVSSTKLFMQNPLDFNDYLQQLIQIYQANNISAFVVQPLENDGHIDFDELKSRLEKIVEYSVANKIDLLKKAYMYVTSIDEPTKNDYDKVKKINNKIERIKDYLLLKDYCGETDIYNSVKNLENIVTVFIQEELYDNVKIWCPTYSGYHMPELRYLAFSRRNMGDRLWFYGCVWPLRPFPNYHLEDDLISGRIVGFMQAFYGIEGNLYWSVNLTRGYDLDKKEYYSCNVCENPMLFPPVNGDGYLLYDGKKYNENCYLPSLRLDSVKNGIYDYQILFMLKIHLERLNKVYNTQFSLQKYIEVIADKLFFGAIIKRGELEFNFAINLIMDLLCLAVRHDILINVEENIMTLYNCKATKINLLTNGNEFFIDEIKFSVNKNMLKIRIQDYEYSYLFEKPKQKLTIKDCEFSNLTVKKHIQNSKITINKLDKGEKAYIISKNANIDLTKYNEVVLKTATLMTTPLVVQLQLTDGNNSEFIIDYGVLDKDNTTIRFYLQPMFSVTFGDFETTAISNQYESRARKCKTFAMDKIKKWCFIFNNFKTFDTEEKISENGYEFIINSISLL